MEKSIFQIPLKVLKRYKFYKRSQFCTEAQIEDFQDEQLIKLIQHAGQHVPYYRNLFKNIGFNDSTFRGREDMHKIPTLDKEIVRTRQKELIADNAKKFGITWDSTSGSTGTPLHFVLDDAVQANKIAALLRSYSWAGYKLGKKTFSLQSYYFQEKSYEYSRFYNIIRFDSNKLKKSSAIKVIKEINRLKPEFFMGFPFDILMLSKFAEEEGIVIHSPQSIVTYGETLSKKKREFIEKAYRCKIFDFFSLHECAAMISECEQGNLHLVEDFAFHELLGDGKLVGTSFYNYAMPLIRYEIGDNIVLDDVSKKCECGRNFRIVKEITGKQCDYIETPDGRFLGSVMSHSIDNAKGVLCSQCVQNAIDQIDINIVVDKTYNDDSKIALKKGLRKRLGNEVKINFKVVPQLEKSKSGKTPFIISKIGNKYI
ncbi:MAG: phenylacetate--CoA ligase family protein [Candidatus Cloacimonetes bacterium]|nr:phenylacetate--CoA ligase family protein [Candidatus Cloacimonadota bacterium]